MAIDVAFAVDTSGSIGLDNFRQVKEFLMAMVLEHDVGEDAAHFATIYFSDNANILFNFNTLKGSNLTANHVAQLLQDLPYEGGETNIDKALTLAEKDVFSSKGGWRDDYSIPKVSCNLL